MDILLQQIINGLVLGSMYALIALGYTMVYGIIQLINFAHGEVLMIGALTSWSCIGMMQAAMPGAPGWLILLLAGIWTRRMPWVVLPGLALLNIGTFFAYWKDKVAAEAQAIRIREDVLHALALLGGWPAAGLAQQVLRHKTIKRSFQAMFWLTVLVNVAALAVWVLWPVFNPEPPPPPPEPWQ